MFDSVLPFHLVGVVVGIKTIQTWLLVIICTIRNQHSQTNNLIVISYLRSVALQAPLFLFHPRYSRPSAVFLLMLVLSFLFIYDV